LLEALSALPSTPIDFEKTLLIVNYNHPYYQTIPFLREVYGKVFPNIVFYGEKEDPQVTAVDQYYGWWGHRVVADAMARFPDFEGYICVQDDCWINFWNLSRLDKDKIWFSPYLWDVSLHTLYFGWNWWNLECGREAILQALPKIPEENRDILEINMGKDCVGFTWSDFVYVPGSYREAFINLCSCFDSPPAFVELAIPNILLCLTDRNNWELLNVHWGVENLQQEYQAAYDWIHPIKFSVKENREFIREVVEEYSSGWETGLQ
jgi:hypothetical protein